MAKTERYYTESDAVYKDGEPLKDIAYELNTLDYYRKHHKRKRKEMEDELELAYTVIDGVIAYLRLKERGLYVDP